MKKTVAMLVGLTALTAAPADARDDCFVPMSGWQPREAVVRMVEGNGWQLRRIKISDGCYEVYALDPQGRRMEVKIHPETLEMLKLEYEKVEEGNHD